MSKPPIVITVFGASGDLSKLKIFPAVYAMYAREHVGEELFICGYARTDLTDEQFRDDFEQSVRNSFGEQVDDSKLKALLDRTHYFAGEYDSEADFEKYFTVIQETCGSTDAMHVSYFSVPSFVFEDIIRNLGDTAPNKENMRIVLEKPFGEDEASATNLFHFIARYFTEEQVYLLDHYLGKPSVQSILQLRRANALLNLVLRPENIANIQITAYEKVGVETRVGYFDQFGTLKDMIQSHLLQLLALSTMSIPITSEAEGLQREKQSILGALVFPEHEHNVVLGQFDGYKQLPGVGADSTTDTFAAVRLFIDREDWHEVPIYIRSGKQLHEKHTFVAVELNKLSFQQDDDPPNRLVLELQPKEQINITLLNRMGQKQQQQQVVISDTIACDTCLPEHAVLLLDVIHGRRKHFLSFPEVIAGWKFVDEVTKVIQDKNIKPELYSIGTPGPDGQYELAGRDGFEWFDLDS